MAPSDRPSREVHVLDDDREAYLLLLLADGNLPTGAFVASSGLESFIKHGFSSSPRAGTTLHFVRCGVASYARGALAFVKEAHAAAQSSTSTTREEALGRLAALDALYETMTLNHVARRASATQGIALLTLYSKGFTRPHGMPYEDGDEAEKSASAEVEEFVVELKAMIRRGAMSGHLPICWGVLTGVLGLSCERSQYLHLFLHARSLLSASVRLNTLGPYAAQQLLLHAVRPLVDAETKKCANLRTGLVTDVDSTTAELEEDEDTPANTWPLGEILATRHDLQHSRIFNS